MTAAHIIAYLWLALLLAFRGRGSRTGAASMSAHTVAWRYDPAVARRAIRRGRERGCWVYIPRDELERAGIPIDAAPPWYKTRGAQSRKSSHRCIVSLWPEV